MTISFRQFARSRWLPWMLVLITAALLVTGGLQLRTAKREVTNLEQEVTRLDRELSQTEWALKQAQQKKTIREEVRPDGTKIVEREETNTQTESAGTTTTQRDTQVQEKTKLEQSSVGPGWSFGLGASPQLTFPPKWEYDVRLGYRLGDSPFWLEGGTSIDNQTYMPNKFGLGIRWEF